MWVSPLSTISRGGRHNPFESTDADRGVKQEEVVRVFCCGAASSNAGGEGEVGTKVYRSIYQVFFIILYSQAQVCVPKALISVQGAPQAPRAGQEG
jgi:hypothetical protein